MSSADGRNTANSGSIRPAHYCEPGRMPAVSNPEIRGVESVLDRSTEPLRKH